MYYFQHFRLYHAITLWGHIDFDPLLAHSEVENGKKGGKKAETAKIALKERWKL